MSKKEFILKHSSLKAAEVVERAAAEGIKINQNYVNVVRSNARTQAKRLGLDPGDWIGDAANDAKPAKASEPKRRGKSKSKFKFKKMLKVAKEKSETIKENAKRIAIIMPATQTEAEHALNVAGLRLMEALNEHSRAVIRVALESVAANLSGSGK